jgi:hypothetical protein
MSVIFPKSIGGDEVRCLCSVVLMLCDRRKITQKDAGDENIQSASGNYIS